MPTTPGSANGGAPSSAMSPEAELEQHEQDVEDREAYEYWGFMFKADKTGTDRLKALLRGLKDVMNEKYEPSDNPDLTPNQLAHFYRELHGNYDQLFLGTPSESIAFIYKSLGCLHSLQPLPHSTAFTEPTVPALKTEGWIMWQTIQLLLGPDEHSSFLIEAAQKWDIKDPVSGEALPKILPRKCFPMEPDKHMVAWYEGVSERLRKEAEDEERRRDVEAQQAEVRRINDRVPHPDTDEEGSVDSKGPALAYFRNPLYRHVDGRPTIVRRSSKRPTLSPRPTMMEKGKGAASSVGHVIKNIGSPHLWEGHRSSSKSRERAHREHRRRSLPENRFYDDGGAPPQGPAGHDSKASPHHHRRKRSGQSMQMERPGTGDGEDEWDEEGGGTPIQSPYSRQNRHGDDHDPSLRHSRSHEPTPSQKEYPDYFHGYDANASNNDSRRSSAQPDTPPVASNGMGSGFGPSASPLFASHIAKQPQPAPPPFRPSSNLPPPDPYGRPPRPHSMRRAPPTDRPYSRSPDPASRFRDREREDRDPRRFSSHDRAFERRPRFESPGPTYDGMSPPPPGPSRGRDREDMMGGPYGPRRGRSRDYGPPMDGGGGPPSMGGRPRSHSHRMSGSDVSGPDERDRDRDRDGGRRKQTRFAAGAAGVDGRRYPGY